MSTPASPEDLRAPGPRRPRSDSSTTDSRSFYFLCCRSRPITFQRVRRGRAGGTKHAYGIVQTLEPFLFVSRQPAVHRLPTDTPILCHLGHAATVSDYRQHCLVPFAHSRSFPSCAGVSRLSRSRCKASPEVVTTISRRPLVALQPNFFATLQGVPV